jgi:hypothetical protein
VSYDAFFDWAERCAVRPDFDPWHMIIASPLVPWGRYFRYYDTSGRLTLYVSRGEFYDALPAHRPTWGFRDPAVSLSGVPVVVE